MGRDEKIVFKSIEANDGNESREAIDRKRDESGGMVVFRDNASVATGT